MNHHLSGNITNVNTKQFMDAVFPDGIPQGYYANVWRLADKRSAWFDDVQQIAQQVSSRAVNQYVCIGLSDSKRTEKQRLKAAEVAGIVGLYIDLDVSGAGHKKTKLPPDFETAQQIIDAFPLKPTVTVNTGGGLQAWFIFREPWLFESDAEREQAAQLFFRFNHTFKQNYSGGYEIDSIYNLDRLGRLPGTINRKPGRDDAQVQIINVTGTYYNPEDIEQHCLLESEISTTRSAVEPATAQTAGELALDPDAQFNVEVFDALMENDTFRQTWHLQRDDLPSASEYDMSLAVLGHQHGLPAQEIANLIISWRRKHAGKTIGKSRQPIDAGKALRADYIRRTLDQARAAAESEQTGSPCALIKRYLGVTVHSITEYKGDTSNYVMETDAGTVNLPSTKDLASKGRLEVRFIEDIKRTFELKRDEWKAVKAALVSMITTVEIGGDAVASVRIPEMVVEWISSHKLSREGDHRSRARMSGVGDRQPNVLIDNDGTLLFKINNFLQDMHTRGLLHDSHPVVKSTLKRQGFESNVKVNIQRDNGNRTTGSFWRVPATLMTAGDIVGE